MHYMRYEPYADANPSDPRKATAPEESSRQFTGVLSHVGSALADLMSGIPAGQLEVTHSGLKATLENGDGRQYAVELTPNILRLEFHKAGEQTGPRADAVAEAARAYRQAASPTQDAGRHPAAGPAPGFGMVEQGLLPVLRLTLSRLVHDDSR